MNRLILVVAASVLMFEAAYCSSLKEQHECDLLAEQTFNKSGHNTQKGDAYISHYDEIAQKCFMGVQSRMPSGTETMIFQSVWDAVGGEVYGSYVWATRPGKKYWEVPPIQCQVTTLSGERILCKDDDEFDDLSRKNFGIFFK